DLGLAEKMAIRALAAATGTEPAEVAARVRDAGDLGQAAEQLLAADAAGRARRSPPPPPPGGRAEPRRAAAAPAPARPGRQPRRGGGLLARAAPLAARSLRRSVVRPAASVLGARTRRQAPGAVPLGRARARLLGDP